MHHGKTIEVPGCRRHDPREGVTLAASALALGCSRSVCVSDLSSSGAQFDATGLPAVGDDVLMIAGSQEAFGKIVWRTEKKCGVRFDEALGESAIVLMKREAAWSEVACFYN